MQQEKRVFTYADYPRNECPAPERPSPDQGPIEMLIWRMGMLEELSEKRLARLEDCVEKLIAAMNKQNGAIAMLKILGAFLVGAAVVLAFFFDRFP